MLPDKKQSHESLSEIAARIRKTIRDSDRSILECAREIVKMSKNWAHYRQEANGLEINKWLVKEIDPTRRLSWYIDRVERADKIGPIAQRLDHQSIYWLGGAVTDPENIKSVAQHLNEAFMRNGRVLLKKSQVVRICERFTTKGQSRMRTEDKLRIALARITRLEEQLRKAGLEPVE